MLQQEDDAEKHACLCSFHADALVTVSLLMTPPVHCTFTGRVSRLTLSCRG